MFPAVNGRTSIRKTSRGSSFQRWGITFDELLFLDATHLTYAGRSAKSKAWQRWFFNSLHPRLFRTLQVILPQNNFIYILYLYSTLASSRGPKVIYICFLHFIFIIPLWGSLGWGCVAGPRSLSKLSWQMREMNLSSQDLGHYNHYSQW